MSEALRRTIWSAAESPEIGAAALCSLSDRYEAGHTRRKLEAIRLMQVYEGQTVGGFSAAALDQNGTFEGADPLLQDEPVDQTLNIGQDIVDTLNAKVASLENNKPQIVVTDGAWETRRQAILADRFIEGQFHERQGKFFDLWDMFQHALRLALASTRTSAVKFFSDDKAGKICAELHDTLSMWVDVSGHPYDYPTNMGEVTYWDPDKLIAKYPQFEAKIVGATAPVRTGLGLEVLDQDYDYLNQDVQRVKVVEGWRFKHHDKPGKYCMAIKDQVLEWMDYGYEDPPFVFVGGIRSLTGFWHRTLTKSIAAPILRTNQILGSLDASERLTPKGVMYYDPEETPKEQLESVDDVILIPVVGLNSGRGKPQYEQPPPFHPLVLELIRFYKEQCYDLSGVSQMHTAGRREQGLTSGVALRIVKQLINERFAPIQRAYIQASCIEASKQIIRCAKELAESNPKFASTWKGEGFMKQIDVGVLSILDKQKYSVDVYAVSETKNSPEDRVSLAEELMAGGIITGEAFVSVLKHYDTFGETEVSSSQRRFIAKQIDKWLFSDPKELSQKGFYRGPIKTMNLYAAVVQVNKAYLDAMTDEVDQRRLNYFSRFLVQAQKFLEEKQARAAALAAKTGGTAAGAQAIMQAAGEAPQQAA